MTQNTEFDLRFLESAENVKKSIFNATGREPNSEVARGVSICIQQGRMFFDSAAEAPTEIRPLLLYYGMMAFAKSIVSGRRLRHLSTLQQSHGLKDNSVQGSRVEDLKVLINGFGTFQEFNDEICALEGIDYFVNAMSRRHVMPTANSAALNGVEISLIEIFSRIPSLSALYKSTLLISTQN